MEDDAPSTPELITSPASLAAAHGPGITITHGSGAYSFLADGALFTKYHQQPTFLNASGKRLVFYQHNHLFWLKAGVGRPRPGEEEDVGVQYQSPLTSIVQVVAGKTERTFRSKQAAAVSDDKAWSLLVRRSDDKEEHVDLEAASKEQRDAWVKALQVLVAKAKETEVEREAKVRVVELHCKVDGSGLAVITIAPATPHTPPVRQEPSLIHITRTPGDASEAAPPRASQPFAAAASSFFSAAANAMRSAATPSTTLPSSSAPADTDARVVALTRENEQLKTTIAELEEQVKSTHVDSVPAS